MHSSWGWGAGTGTSEILLRSRGAGLLLSDRVGERLANGDIIGLRQRRDEPVDVMSIRLSTEAGRCSTLARWSAESSTTTSATCRRSYACRRAAAAPRWRPRAALVHLERRLLGALESLISGVYKGRCECRRLFAVSYVERRGTLRRRPTTASRCSGQAPKDEPVYARLDVVLSDRAPGAAPTSRTCSPGRSRAPAGTLAHPSANTGWRRTCRWRHQSQGAGDRCWRRAVYGGGKPGARRR